MHLNGESRALGFWPPTSQGARMAKFTSRSRFEIRKPFAKAGLWCFQPGWGLGRPSRTTSLTTQLPLVGVGVKSPRPPHLDKGPYNAKQSPKSFPKRCPSQAAERKNQHRHREEQGTGKGAWKKLNANLRAETFPQFCPESHFPGLRNYLTNCYWIIYFCIIHA